MITSVPRASAPPTYSAVCVGVRCAESTRHSCAMSNLASTSAAWRITSQSDLLPMITATSGASVSIILLPLRQREAGLAVESAQRFRHGNIDSRIGHAPRHIQQLGHIRLTLGQEAASEAIRAESLGNSRG